MAEVDDKVEVKDDDGDGDGSGWRGARPRNRIKRRSRYAFGAEAP